MLLTSLASLVLIFLVSLALALLVVLVMLPVLTILAELAMLSIMLDLAVLRLGFTVRLLISTMASPHNSYSLTIQKGRKLGPIGSAARYVHPAHFD